MSFLTPKSSRLHSGSKDVLQNSMEDLLEIYRRMSSSSPTRTLILAQFFYVGLYMWDYPNPDHLVIWDLISPQILVKPLPLDRTWKFTQYSGSLVCACPFLYWWIPEIIQENTFGHWFITTSPQNLWRHDRPSLGLNFWSFEFIFSLSSMWFQLLLCIILNYLQSSSKQFSNTCKNNIVK